MIDEVALRRQYALCARAWTSVGTVCLPPLKLRRLTGVELIAATTNSTGVEVAYELDETDYSKGIKASDAEMAALAITRDGFNPKWDYAIAPRTQNQSSILA